MKEVTGVIVMVIQNITRKFLVFIDSFFSPSSFHPLEKLLKKQQLRLQHAAFQDGTQLICSFFSFFSPLGNFRCWDLMVA